MIRSAPHSVEYDMVSNPLCRGTFVRRNQLSIIGDRAVLVAISHVYYDASPSPRTLSQSVYSVSCTSVQTLLPITFTFVQSLSAVTFWDNSVVSYLLT